MNKHTADALGITFAITHGPRRGQVSDLAPSPRLPMREYPAPDRRDAPNPLEPIMVGPRVRGQMGRALAGMLGSGGPGTSIHQQRTLAPTTDMRGRDFGDAIIDRYGNVIGYLNPLGAADANYQLPNVPTTRNDAIMAYVKLVRLAKDEKPGSAAYYQARYSEAGYKFSKSTPLHIMQSAVGVTNGAPGANNIAVTILKAMSPAKAPPKAKTPKKRRARTEEAPTEEAATEDSPVAAPAAPAPWYSTLPSWAPMAASAAGIALLAIVAWPRSRPASV